jgi:hypothetical protein
MAAASRVNEQRRAYVGNPMPFRFVFAEGLLFACLVALLPSKSWITRRSGAPGFRSTLATDDFLPGLVPGANAHGIDVPVLASRIPIPIERDPIAGIDSLSRA